MIDFVSSDNPLILNPRLPQATLDRYIEAWRQIVLGRFTGQVGLATSGSSGDAFGKIIVLSKTSLLVAAASANQRLQVRSTDVWMKSLPNFHVGGLSICARAHLSGSRVVEPTFSKWDATLFVAEVEESQATLTSLVPTQIFDLVQAGLRPPERLRAVIVGGGRFESDLYRRAVELGWPVLPSYGMTECGSQVATALSTDDSALVPLSHVELRIAADERIQIRSAALLTGLIRFDSEGAAAFEDPKKGGWFVTEDRGRLMPDGSLVILGRNQDFVKIGGEGVLLSRLEEKLDALRLSLASEGKFKGDAAILAATDARLGATLVLLTDVGVEAARPLVEAFNLAVVPFERIRSVYSVAAIPRSPLGKLLRRDALALVGLEPAANV